MLVEDLLRRPTLDKGGSVRDRFRRHITHIVQRYGGAKSPDDDRQRTENLLFARKLAGAVEGERIRDMLTSRPQYHERQEELHGVLALLFLVLDLVTVVTGRDCDAQIIERDDQLHEYPANAPTIYLTFEVLISLNQFAGESAYNIQYLQHELCRRIYFLNDPATRGLCVKDMFPVCLLTQENNGETAERMSDIGSL